ncbi:unnamed protein product [Arabis nemorensis]|uniref:Uncharacterized protein n=1 Tax=Arabis nemorensis TaxID=586526 RepID=A0A565B2H3_9BRAS|nr:unnamed protein product [Arabis nemorensis]
MVVSPIRNQAGVGSHRALPMDDGFTMVRRNGRREEGTTNRVVFGAGGSGSGERKNIEYW